MRRAAVLLLLGLAACAGPAPASPPEATDALVDVWAAVPVGMARLAGADVPAVCDEPFGTWFADFGVRGLACAADQKVPLAEAAGRAPSPIWTTGPHRPGGSGLDLTAPRAFGHYDPAFVEWAVANAVPTSPAAVALARPVYDAHVRRLARVYWLSYGSLEADGFPDRLPAGGAAAYGAYLEGGPVPEGAAGYVSGPDGTGGRESGVSVFALFDRRSRPVAAALTRQMAPPAGDGVVTDWNEWEVRYEANTALGFWVRRRADGTLALFHDGLAELLATFDAAWLTANGG